MNTRADEGGAARRLLSAWFEIDVRSLAALRVVLATAIISRLVGIFPDFVAFLSDDGVLPRSLLFEHTPSSLSSVYFLNGTPAFALVILFIHLAAALMLLVGFRTRTATVVCWVLGVSLAMRNPYISTGGDTLAALLLFWGMFLPLGATFSADAALADERPHARSYVSVATAGLLLQAMYVYFFGALMKTGPEWLPNGSAVYAALHFETTATHLAHWLRQHTSVTYYLTFFVFGIELLSPLLLFSPVRTAMLRMIVLPAYAFMHIGFRIFLSIGNFWLVSLSSLCAFAPREAWDQLERLYWREEHKSITIHYEGECGFCRKTSLLLREYFLPREARVLAATSEFRDLLEREQSWIVTDWRGRRYLHWNALVFVCSQSLLARPLGLLLWGLGALGIGRPLYNLIGKKRRSLSMLAPRLRPPSLGVTTSKPLQLALYAVIGFCLLWNVREAAGVRTPSFLQGPVEAARAFGLLQRWTMFAPMPQLTYAVPVVEGTLENGERVDVLNNRPSTPSYQWPRYPIDAVRSSAWRKYFNTIGIHSEAHAREYFAAYATFVCSSWNTAHRDGPPIRRVTITLLIGRTLSHGVSDRHERRVYAYECPRDGI